MKPRKGILLYGPPGTGKTLLVKCIAKECNLNFLNIKGPELLNMYIGESEKNIRKIFEKARHLSPSIIFFDELDSLAPKRGNQSDSQKVMDRIVSQFLTEFDKSEENQRVFVIAATNRPDMLDLSLLRPGRFDKMVYLGIDSSLENKMAILKAQMRKIKVDN